MHAATLGPQVHAGPLVAIVGPTAAGKSELAVELAQRHRGEIVNADAMAMYRGMDVGTAKPEAEQRARVPHHCLDLWEVATAASVADFQRRARAAIADIHRRGGTPLVVGGSPLYARMVCDVFEVPPRDPALRRRLEEELLRSGSAPLHERLRALDPDAAAAIDPRNTRRVVRALEVALLTGSFRARLPEPVPFAPTLWLGRDLDRPELDERITARANRMWAGGALVAEAASIPDLASAPTAARAIGYQQALAVLAGELGPQQGLQETIRLTRRLARRQQRTFRADDRIVWLRGTAAEALAQAEPLLAAHLAHRSRA